MTNSNSENSSVLVPAGQAARRLGLNHQTFLRWLREGQISGVKIAGSWFLHPATIESIRHRALIGETFERHV